MPDSAVLYIFFASILIFLSGAVLSLVFSNDNSLCRFISYICAIISSTIGIFLSLLFLMKIISQPVIIEFETTFDFFKLVFRLDNISAFFILLISVLALVVSIYSIGYVKHYENKSNTGLLGALYNIFLCSMILVVSCGHLFMFLIAWEIMSLASYFLVIYENEKAEVQKAGLIYIIMTHIGTAFITAAFILIYKFSGQASIQLIDISTIPSTVKNIIFILLLAGFGTKGGMIPLHIWLPYAHPAAPSNISALMSGVMIKTAVYGLLRFVVEMMHADKSWWGMTILTVGAISMSLGIIYALMEQNIKKLLAYSSVENIGIIFMGLGLGIIANAGGHKVLAALSITASLLHTFNHGIFKGLLFLGAGSIHYSTGTKDMEKLGGLIKKMPITAIFFLIASLSICALPPLNGFVSEWLTYQSMFINILEADSFTKLIILVTAALLALTGALAAYCFVKAYGISFLAVPRSEHSANAKEVSLFMLMGMGILSLACLLLGVFPRIFISLLEPINKQLFNTGIDEGLGGFSSFVMYPLKINDISISPAALLLIMLIIFIASAIIIYLVSSKKKARTYVTWDCGYVKLDNRMQYSATGFSKPARIVFRSIFRPRRELKIEEGVTPYHVKAAKYNVSTLSLIETYFYNPTVKRIINFARKARFSIQTGSIHTYLLYIFITILLMFVYYALAVGNT